MSRRRGAILPLFAVSIVMLISAVGLALDGAYAAAAGRDLQSIADYSARVAADRAAVECGDEEAPGVICPLDLPRATAALARIREQWDAAASSLRIRTMSVTASPDGTQVIVSVDGCHAPLLLSFLYPTGQAGCSGVAGHPLALTATDVSNVGAGH